MNSSLFFSFQKTKSLLAVAGCWVLRGVAKRHTMDPMSLNMNGRDELEQAYLEQHEEALASEKRRVDNELKKQKKVVKESKSRQNFKVVIRVRPPLDVEIERERARYTNALMRTDT